MGTFYHVKVVKKNRLDLDSLTKRIDRQLLIVNQSMSVYDPKSEISIFNAAEKGVLVPVSHDFMEVMEISEHLYQLTSGAWDGTVKPLVDIWGFGTKGSILKLPEKEAIDALVDQTGFHNIEISAQGLKKKNETITLDMGSIAKGYGVDAIAKLLQDCCYKDFIVEIGGEVMAMGEKKSGHPWTVGISTPKKHLTTPINQAIYRAVPLKNRAMATSGDYRNFITIDNKDYSHIINPATGYPVSNGVISATVISKTCTFADGLATALMVMEPEDGIKLVNTIDETECMIIKKEKQGKLTNYMSVLFPK